MVASELIKDWFIRNHSTFVADVDDDGSRVKWEDTVDTSAYSEFIGKVDSVKDLIRVSYARAKDVVTAFGFTQRVYVFISKHKESYTNGKYIHLSTTCFDEETYSYNARLDVFMGTAVHECCHLKYTDFAAYGKGLEDDPDKKQFKLFVRNVLEDEYIEKQLVSDFPGFIRFIEAVKHYYFNVLWMEGLGSKEDETPLSKASGIFLRLIRYPVFMERDLLFIEDHQEFFIAVKEVLADYPDSTVEVVEAADAITELFFKEFPQEEMSEEDKKKIEDFISELNELLELLGKDDVETSKSLSGYDAEIIEGTVDNTSDEVFFIRSEDNESVYRNSLARVRSAAKSMESIVNRGIRDYALTVRGASSGKLDANRYSDALSGCENIYIRQGLAQSKKLCVVALGDESGSMYLTAIQYARDLMVMLNEAFSRNPDVDLFLYGHTGDVKRSGATEIYVYREKGYSPKYALGNVAARSQNRDGVAIYAVAERVRRMTQHPIIMFVMSDGVPWASKYTGEQAIKDTREKVTLAQKRFGVTVIQVHIGSEEVPSHRMFDHWVHFKDLHSFPTQMGKMVQTIFTKHNSMNCSV